MKEMYYRASGLLVGDAGDQSVQRRGKTHRALAGLALLAPTVCAAQAGKAPAGGTEEEIAALVRDLGEASYDARTQATLRLITLGSKTRPLLEKAAAGNDVEQSLRAKRILQIFDSLYFLDTKVEVSFAESKVDWDRPAELTITLTNTSEFPSRVPFELDAAKREQAEGNARQVADMLDVAEWLHVFGPSGAQVSLRVDDIAKDPAVVKVVEERLSGGPTSTLKPGEKAVLRIADLNRSWARFPLLDAGEYTVFLEFVPTWNDESLAEARVGYVRSNTATITVAEGAPASVSRSGVEAEVTVEREGDELVARLINHDDLPVIANVNFGASIPMALGAWIVEQGERRADVPIAAEASWRDFSEKKLVELAPGQSVELGRIDRAALAKAALGAGKSAGLATVAFTYASFCDRVWQEREGMLRGDANAQPDVLRRPLPHRLLATRQTSSSIPLAGGP